MADRRYTLSLMGSPQLRNPAGELVSLPGKTFALIAILQSYPDRRGSRRVLANLLYGEAGQVGAMTNLRQLLKRVQSRQADLGLRLLVLSQDEVQFLPDPSTVTVDLDEFAGTEIPRDGRELASIADRYGGDLLEGFEGGGEAFDSWLLAQRIPLRKRYVDLLRAAAANIGGPDGEGALRRVLQIEPYQEANWRELLGLVWKRSGLDAAEQTFREMRESLGSDLGVLPGSETMGLMEALRRSASEGGLRVSHARPAEALLRAPSDQQPAGTAVPRLCILMPPVARADTHAGLVGSLLEDVTLGLCRLRSIALIAPHTSWRLAQDREQSLDDLQLDYLVETNLGSSGRHPRVYVKLVRMSDRVIISGDVYDLSEAYLGHHERLTKLIVQALADGLERSEAERFSRSQRPDAYQWLLQGRQHMRVLGLPDLRRARKAFSQAMECDPGFAPALSGTARTLILEWLLLSQTDRSLLVEAQSIARRATELDPFSGEALRDYAGSTLLLGGLDEARDRFSMAEQLTPHHADILADHANALTHCSDMEAALTKIELAIRLNPLPPDDYHWTAGGALFFLNDFEGALSHLGRMKRPEPAYRLTAACLAMLERRREAKYFVAKALEDQPNFLVDDWLATIPLRSRDHARQYADALSRAGFR